MNGLTCRFSGVRPRHNRNFSDFLLECRALQLHCFCHAGQFLDWWQVTVSMVGNCSGTFSNAPWVGWRGILIAKRTEWQVRAVGTEPTRQLALGVIAVGWCTAHFFWILWQIFSH